MTEMNANGILKLMCENEITLKDLIDSYIENQGIIGVGLITLEEQLGEIVNAHYRRGQS